MAKGVNKNNQPFADPGVVADMERDVALVQRCQQGDRRAMEALVTQYQQPVYNAAYRLLGNPNDAADATQASFLKAFQHLDSYNQGQRFFSWLYRIAVNEALDQLRRRRQRGPDLGAEVTDSLVDDAVGLDTAADNAQQQKDLQRVLMLLGDDLRTVVVLRYYGGASYRDMAEVLGIEEKTVKSRLFTARQRMKLALESAGVLQA